MNGEQNRDILVLGAGLAGLAAGAVLADQHPVTLVERGPVAGGLARTIEQDGFRFDLGGHRFLTGSHQVNALVEKLLGGDLLTVRRRSKIFLRNRYFDYPLKPANALFGLGLPTTLAVLADYALQKVSRQALPAGAASLEDWVVSQFGRKMFNLYFREYSEKVWGVGCDRISSRWVSQRIEGLSLGKAVRSAFSRPSRSGIRTLADRFSYPVSGIGLLADRLRSAIERTDRLLTDTNVLRIDHDHFTVRNVMTRGGGGLVELQPRDVISTIPLTTLVGLLNPAPPRHVLRAANALRYRDLVVCAVMLDCPRATDLTWIYFPEKDVPFGRIHEPRNWSSAMAPQGKTHLVAEYFCFDSDRMWLAEDREISAGTIDQLVRLGFIRKKNVIGSRVVRVARAYPLFDVNYGSRCETVMSYLERFRNLQVAGRTGAFQYLNMDQAMESGMETARSVLRKHRSSLDRRRDGEREAVNVC